MCEGGKFGAPRIELKTVNNVKLLNIIFKLTKASTQGTMFSNTTLV